MFKVLPKKVWIPILIAVIVILVGGVLAYQYCWLPKEETNNNNNNNNNIACTMEAKLCPDGS